MSFTVQRSGYTDVPGLFYQVVTDLLANGFTLVYPTSPLPAPSGSTPYTPFAVTLTASATVDPAYTQQPWNIMFDCTGHQTLQSGSTPQVGDIFVGTSLQLPSTGGVTPVDVQDGGSTQYPLPSGHINGLGHVVTTTTVDNVAMSFITRKQRIIASVLNGTNAAGNYPMTYRLSVGANGFTLFVWEDASDNIGGMFSWISIQRPVDHLTGAPVITGHAPLFATFGMNGDVFKLVVRENDILKPTVGVSASKDTINSAAIINVQPQVAISENNKYVITFPNGLNTQRYAYTSELDMIAYTSANVVAGYTDVPLTVYGESTPRTYKAMSATDANNTGMRLLMLTAGGPMA
jgi:hypothetical protein